MTSNSFTFRKNIKRFSPAFSVPYILQHFDESEFKHMKYTPIYDEEPSILNHSQEQYLIAEVFIRAFYDLFEPKHRGDVMRWIRERDESLDTSERISFSYACECLNLDSKQVRRKFTKIFHFFEKSELKQLRDKRAVNAFVSLHKILD